MDDKITRVSTFLEKALEVLRSHGRSDSSTSSRCGSGASNLVTRSVTARNTNSWSGTAGRSDSGTSRISGVSNTSPTTSGGNDRVPVGVDSLLRFIPRRSGILTTRGKPYDRKSTSSITWTHKFVCLSDTEFDRVPTATEKYNLKCAGLGEKKIVFQLSGGWAHTKETLLQEYPVLSNAGGFELLRTDGPYSRRLVIIDTTFLASVSKLKQFIDQACIYVRPLQANLVSNDGGSDSKQEEVNEKCLICEKYVSLSDLRDHMEVCHEADRLYREQVESERTEESPPPLLPPASGMEQPNMPVTHSTSCYGKMSTSIGNVVAELPSQLPAGYVFSEYISLIDDDEPSYPDESSDIQEAIAKSITDAVATNKDKPFNSSKDLLKEHVQHLQILDGPDHSHQLVTVRRRQIWPDLKRCFAKPYYNFQLPVKVVFSGEPAADQGGPRREFFRLGLSASLGDPSLFMGPTDCRAVLHNSTACLLKHYQYVGNLISMSLTQGGPGPACFLQWMYSYLCFGLECKIEVSDVPDPDVRAVLAELQAVPDDTALRQLIMEERCSVVFDSGFNTPVTQVTLGDIPLMAKAVCLHMVITPVKAELDQLAGILNFIKNYPQQSTNLFVHDPTDKLSAEMMIALFGFNYSELGSTRRIAEESVIQYWNECVQDLDYRIISTTLYGLDGMERTLTLHLEDMLVFVTGADRIPPMGFEYSPFINFVHNPPSHLPTASTCAPSLDLPVVHGQSYEQFKDAMVEALVGVFGFGQV